jgi:hypothetical protein
MIPGRNQALKAPQSEAFKIRQHNGPMQETKSRRYFTKMAMQFHKTKGSLVRIFHCTSTRLARRARNNLAYCPLRFKFPNSPRAQIAKNAS